MRLEHINKVITSAIFICDLCHENLAMIECVECKENYCFYCSKDIHEKWEDDNEIHPKKALF